MKIVDSWEDRIFINVSRILVIFVVIFTLYPFIYVLSSSLSDPTAVMKNQIFLWPIGFSLEAYKTILGYGELRMGYVNTVFYTVTGTAINMLLTSLMAYPLSRRNLVFRKSFMIMITFTLVFSGGLIPTFLIVKSLGMLNTYWALLIPGAISTWNVILMKTFFENLPKELEEAATIDGASAMSILFRIILPLSKPAFVTISLFYAVGHWNSYFPAMIYLQSESLYPVQLFLRKIVLLGQTADITGGSDMGTETILMAESLKYATIIIVALPIILVYPFIQKYFAKGAMIGSLKG
ncbi:carbohydrate ABC transporter permease [Paenibacillus agaridevorans]|uniref:Carbohydrate ABC transporter permease n=1 Tax=Paenibacillus agaridevorans TaxID=171404 RepID=A0A2R5EGA2_9BACL|nr:carbohydrate ABC transporter permease [Paenibacillus agaridevorans]GBG05586.1 carbohydrate ABC transporter permease [Paenibacillus agaridevorans]